MGFEPLSDLQLFKYATEAHGTIRSPLPTREIRIPADEVIAMIEEIRGHRLSGNKIDPVAAKLASEGK